jgi:hypothetical protein
MVDPFQSPDRSGNTSGVFTQQFGQKRIRAAAPIVVRANFGRSRAVIEVYLSIAGKS